MVGIPEDQLTTWSGIGSITQSSTTYATIKNALEASGSPYEEKDYDIFLQGSYGNDTNVYGESDVDIVIKLKSSFNKDLSLLSAAEQASYAQSFSDATYRYPDFKRDVFNHLLERFPGQVSEGKKALKIAPSNSRRSSDVLVALHYRRYNRFGGLADQSYENGICFLDSSGNFIINYPHHHSQNCTAKHQETHGRFKPVVRILKNARSKLVDDSAIQKGTAPSYFIEGLLYNVPSHHFSGSYQACWVNCMNWLWANSHETFMCANKLTKLIGDDGKTMWNELDYLEFRLALENLWNDW